MVILILKYILMFIGGWVCLRRLFLVLKGMHKIAKQQKEWERRFWEGEERYMDKEGG